MKEKAIRQGDVLLKLEKVAALPKGATEIKPDGNRIVLAYGEVTGHAHAIYDHIKAPVATPGAADEIAEAAIARAQSKARMYQAADGVKYLEVTETVTLKHEEHTQTTIDPGIYKLPVQVEYTPQELRITRD